MAAKPWRRNRWDRLTCLLFVGLCAVPPPAAAEDLSNLDKGHRILVQRGLQIQAQCFYRSPDVPAGYTFDPQPYLAANFTGINWHYHPPETAFAATYPAFPWGRWMVQTGQTDLSPPELPYKDALVALQYKDENSLNDPNVRADFKGWFDAARPKYPDAILYTNQLAFDASDANLALYMNESRPDMLCMDSYRWKIGDTEGTWHLFSDMQRYRKWGLLGNDGTGARPIPYALFPQTFRGENLWRDPSESEMRVNHFGAWAFGYKVTFAFTYNYGSSSLFSPGWSTGNPTPLYHQLKEINRHGRNLGPALVRLLSRDVRFIAGQSRDGGGNIVNNPNPIDMLNWVFGVNDPYLRGWVVTNLGTKNDGLQGDVVLAWFKVLDESFDGPDTNEIYMMVLNALRDPSGSAADCRQRIQLNFQFGASGIDTVQRLSRDTGQLDEIYMEVIPDSGGRRQLVLELDGGTADLFKFKTGARFVSFPPPDPPPPDTTPPGPVSQFTATVGAEKLTLSWTNPTDEDFAGTRIRRRTGDYPAGPTDGDLVVDRPGSPGATQSFTDTGLTAGETYYYAAFAHDAVPNYSEASTVTGTPTVRADFDLDGDVDQDDFAFFQLCLMGEFVPHPAGCDAADLNDDGRVGESDFLLFSPCMGGPNRPPNC